MNKILLTMAILLVGLPSIAQTDSLNNDRPMPSTEAREYQTKQEIAEDMAKGENVKESRVEVENDQIPERVKQTLKNDDQYEGWENSTIYFEKNTDQYLVHITDENSTRTYRFSKKGKPVRDVPEKPKDDQ